MARGDRLPLAGVPIAVKAWDGLASPQARALVAAGCVPVGATAVPLPTVETGRRGPPHRPRADGESLAGRPFAGRVVRRVGGLGGGRRGAARHRYGRRRLRSGSRPRGAGWSASGPPTGPGCAPAARWPGPVADAAAYLAITIGTRDAVADHPPLRAVWSADLGYADTEGRGRRPRRPGRGGPARRRGRHHVGADQRGAGRPGAGLAGAPRRRRCRPGAGGQRPPARGAVRPHGRAAHSHHARAAARARRPGRPDERQPHLGVQRERSPRGERARRAGPPGPAGRATVRGGSRRAPRTSSSASPRRSKPLGAVATVTPTGTGVGIGNEDTAGGPTDEDYEALRRRLTFSPEQAEHAREAQRREDGERRRRLFGDREPFAMPTRRPTPDPARSAPLGSWAGRHGEDAMTANVEPLQGVRRVPGRGPRSGRYLG